MSPKFNGMYTRGRKCQNFLAYQGTLLVVPVPGEVPKGDFDSRNIWHDSQDPATRTPCVIDQQP